MRQAVRAGLRADIALTPRSVQAYQPSICLICQHHLLRKSRRLNSIPSNRRNYANDRPAILETSRPNPRASPKDQPVPLSVPASAAQEPSAEAQSPKDDVLTVGGDPEAVEEGLSEAEEAEEYQDQLRREEEELYQRSVDQALKHKEYVPAETWHGLEEVGGETEKDEGETYTPYAGINKLESAEEVTLALHFALVEMFAARSSYILPREMTREELDEVDQMGEDVKRVKLAPSPDGLGATLQYPDGETQERIQRLATRISPQMAPEEEEEAELAAEEEAQEGQTTLPLNEDEARADVGAALDAGVVDMAQLRKDVKKLGRAWLHISLHSPEIKLDLARRIARLTGQHIPDHVLWKASSVGFILNELIRPPPPKKLFDAITGPRSQLPKLANVGIVDHRLMMEDRERPLGRLKVTEAELRERRLPVTHADVRAERLG